MLRLVRICILCLSLIGCFANLNDSAFKRDSGSGSGEYTDVIDLSKWSFSNVGNKQRTNLTKPQLTANLEQSFDGQSVSIFSDSSCSKNIGSAIVSGGEVSVENIEYVSGLSKIEEKKFYLQMTNSQGVKSSCKELSLSYYYQPQNQFFFGMQFLSNDLSRDIIYLGNYFGGIFSYDIQSEVVKEIYSRSSDFGSGIVFENIGDIVTSPDTDVAYVFGYNSSYGTVVAKIDVVSGERTLIVRETDTNYDTLFWTSSIAVNSTNDKIYASVDRSFFATFYEIDIATGSTRQIYSDSADFPRPNKIIVNKTDDLLYVADSNNSIYTIAISDGTKTLISQAGVKGVGDAFHSPIGMALSQDESKIYVADYNVIEAIVEVNISTGDRTIIADASTGSGTSFSQAYYLTKNSDASLLYAIDNVSQELMSVNPLSYVRESLYAPGIGSGPRIYNSLVDSFQVKNQNLLYFASSGNILSVNLDTAVREEIASATTGSGATISGIKGLVANSSNTKIYSIDSGQDLIEITLGDKSRIILSNNSTGGGSATFSTPTGICINSTDTVAYVTDSGNDSIISVDLASGAKETVAAGVTDPIAVIVSVDGLYLYVLESALVVSKIEIISGIRSVISDASTGSGDIFSTPEKIFFNKDKSKLLVTDPGLSCIVEVDLSSGNRRCLYNDSNASQALQAPKGIAFATDSEAVFIPQIIFSVSGVLKINPSDGLRYLFSY